MLFFEVLIIIDTSTDAQWYILFMTTAVLMLSVHGVQKLHMSIRTETPHYGTFHYGAVHLLLPTTTLE
jgi:hypothetical protein